MQTRRYSPNESSSPYIANIIVETLKRTVNNKGIDLVEIAQASRTTSAMAGAVLAELTGLEHLSGAGLSASARFKLALDAAGFGAFERAARALTWREFEGFSEECLANERFETQKGIVFSSDKRRWQIDLTGVKNQTLLAIDCKHWESPYYASKFNKAVEHQKQSLQPLIRHMRAAGKLTPQEVWALPMIITLFEPRESLLNGVVLVSVGQLPEFLERMTPFDPELPFISDDTIAESSIR